MDICEHDNLVCATFELPGLTKEAVNIDLQNNKLTVSGEWPQPTSNKKDEGKSWAHRERHVIPLLMLRALF
jgi:HSP20 family protein